MWLSLQSGDLVFRPDLAVTLELIANHSADIFYKGSIAQSIVKAINSSAERGILTLEDLGSYEALLQEPLQVDYNGEVYIALPKLLITTAVQISDWVSWSLRDYV